MSKESFITFLETIFPKSYFKQTNIAVETCFSRFSPGFNTGSTSFFLFTLKSSTKLFPDDTSLFAIVKDKNESANILNNGQLLISKRVYN